MQGLARLAFAVTPLLTLSFSASALAQQLLDDKFKDEVVISGLTYPTAVQFASDGRVFVAEKGGIVKVFDGLDDVTPEVVIDRRVETNGYWDRGLLGLALDPKFPAEPYIYLLYTRDHGIGGTPPKWGSKTPEESVTDPCPRGDDVSCVATGRLSRVRLEGNKGVEEKALVDDWFVQFPSHSIGSVAFGPDGYLYASGGDGANFNKEDYGQLADKGETFPDDPAREGGVFRSQDLRTEGDAVGLSGTIIRVDPVTGAAAPGNPLLAHADANAKRVVAYGLRNPFRFTFRPGTSELYIGDVAWSRWEEINRLKDPLTVTNFGWPCYEGSEKQEQYSRLNSPICNKLYAESGTVTQPLYAFLHGQPVESGTAACTGRDSSVSGVAFYKTGPYPAEYDNAMFFADYGRHCIFVMFAGPDGTPDPSKRKNFAASVGSPVDLQVGPKGDLFWVDVGFKSDDKSSKGEAKGSVHRIRYFSGNQPPKALFTATPETGKAPLVVDFDASTTSDPDASDKLTYDWDFDGDGSYEGSGIKPKFTYTRAGNYTAQLRVTDAEGEESKAQLLVKVDSSPPVVAITPSAASSGWRAGQELTFTATATDEQDGVLPETALRWRLLIEHCPKEDCHTHLIESFHGKSEIKFVAPDHEFPSHLTLELSASDSSGLITASELELQPAVQTLTVQTEPPGLTLGLGGSTGVAPFMVDVIGDSRHAVSALPQSVGGVEYGFVGWSDGGEALHDVVAKTDLTLTATFAPISDIAVALEGLPEQLAVGDAVEYALTLTNVGPVPLRSVVLSDLAPEQALYLGASAGVFDPQTKSWSGLELAPAQSAQLRFRTTVQPGVTSPLLYGVRASSPGASDPTPENNRVRKEVVVVGAPHVPVPSDPGGAADAGVAMSDGPLTTTDDGGTSTPIADAGLILAPSAPGVDGGVPLPTSARRKDDGCSVGAGVGGSTPAAASLWLLLAGWLGVRRRSARRRD